MTQETLLTLSLVILLLPLLGFMIIIFNQERLGKSAAYIGTGILGLDFILASVVAYSKLTTYATEGMMQWNYNWLELGTRNISVGIGLDNIAAIMLIVVTLISFLVHLFSIEYMHGDKRFPRFFAYLGLFTFSMLGIVIANNFLNMYIFWELVGLSSYFLIGFWYEKDSASNAGKKAFIMNRVGDLGFFIGIMILFYTYGTFVFDDVFAEIGTGKLPFDSGWVLTMAGILIFCGAIGKSAQFPLHTWLPDAMEGPTPVSALIHAATMVAAGVYLTARTFPMFTADALIFVAYIGAITAFLAATIAITQNDFKKVLAYSTVSQLGYMIMAIGVGAFSMGFFHLVTHAWFKACLFLASGSVIHAMHHAMHKAHNHDMDAQDITNMGGLRKTMPLTYMMFLIATIAIAGVPLTSGFLSKDGILAGTLAFGVLSGHWLIPIAGFSAAAMTAFYMFRLGILAFHGKPKTEIAKDTHESNWYITAPLVVLIALTFWFIYSPNPIDANAGWFVKRIAAPINVVPAEYQFDFIVPYDAHNAHTDLMLEEQAKANFHEGQNHDHEQGHHYQNQFEEEMHHQHYTAMFMSLLIAGSGILLSFLFYQFRVFNADKMAATIKPLYNLSYNKWYFDEMYDWFAVKGTLLISKLLALFDNKIIDGMVNLVGTITKFAGWMTGLFDNKIIDGFVNLTAGLVGFFGVVLRKFQTGTIQTYLVLTVLGLLILIVIFI